VAEALEARVSYSGDENYIWLLREFGHYVNSEFDATQFVCFANLVASRIWCCAIQDLIASRIQDLFALRICGELHLCYESRIALAPNSELPDKESNSRRDQIPLDVKMLGF